MAAMLACGCAAPAGGAQPVDGREIKETQSGAESSSRREDLPAGMAISMVDRGERVDFEFGWSGGMLRRYQQRRVIRGNGRRASVELRYTQRISREGGGLSVGRSATGFTGAEGAPERSVQRFAKMAVAEARRYPAFQVDRRARLTHISRKPGAAKLARRIGRHRIPKDADSTAEQLYERAFSSAKALRVDWLYEVELWEGRSFEVGETYRTRINGLYPSPHFGRVRLQLAVEFGVLGRAACEEADSQCVLVRAVVEPDTRRLAEFARMFVEMTRPNQAVATEESAEWAYLVSEMQIHLVVNPETLRVWKAHRQREEAWEMGWAEERLESELRMVKRRHTVATRN